MIYMRNFYGFYKINRFGYFWIFLSGVIINFSNIINKNLYLFKIFFYLIFIIIIIKIFKWNNYFFKKILLK
jgi:hypothetical protein